MARHTDRNGIVTERHGAQITFTQSRSGKRWHGAFVNPASARDRTYKGYDTAAYMVCDIAYKAYDGAYKPDQGRMYYELTTQGREPGGRRYQYYNTLDEAQAAAIKWAARRFYTDTVVPAEPAATSWQDAGYASDPNDAGEHDPYAERNPEAELAEMRSEYRYEDDDRYQPSESQIRYEAELAADADYVKQVEAAQAAYDAQWPHACKRCGGSGRILIPGRRYYHDGSGDTDTVEPCGLCVGNWRRVRHYDDWQGVPVTSTVLDPICPRCGAHGALDDTTGEGPCSACGWNEDSEGRPGY